MQHLVSGTSWVAPLVEGSTIAVLGGRAGRGLRGGAHPRPRDARLGRRPGDRADEALDPELVDVARKVLADKADLWGRHGALGPAVETAPGADAQTLLLAESGRKVV